MTAARLAIFAGVALLALPAGTSADEGAAADRLARFVIESCEFFAENRYITPEEAQPHFGAIVRKRLLSR